jgi:hypothetical protein
MKKELILMLLISFIAFTLMNIFLLVWISSSELSKFTGEAGNLGYVYIHIESGNEINISSPLNTTYNFSFGENYTLDLNVSEVNFVAESWWYTLIDKRHGLTVYQDVLFTPNTTFDAVQFENELIVYANDTNNNIASKSVEFFVALPNSAPQIHYLDPEIFVCEGNYTSYFFNVTDLDEETPVPYINPTAPASPFYIVFSRSINYTVKAYEIFSGTIPKSYLGGVNVGSKTFNENISVSDGESVDSGEMNITIIEINRYPNVSSIGVQTIWGVGDNRTFYHQLIADDREDGEVIDGNLSIQMIILNSTNNLDPIFPINSTGVINFTANQSYNGTYRIWIIVLDNGLTNAHPNITDFCGENANNKSSYVNFSLTITDENRPPYITSHYPENNITNLTFHEGELIYFNITMWDPDWTPLDAYWYFEEGLIKYDPGFDNGNSSELYYRLHYNSQGNRTIRVNVTDGDLENSYDSFAWNITVIDVPLPPGRPPEGGGGGPGTPICIEKWGCSSWNECKNAKDALEMNVLSEQEYIELQENCKNSFWNEEYCGFQIRECSDVNECNTTLKKPSEMQACYYTENPNCQDGIKNCHDGSCEILIDCGGPCKPCPTCSDRIQNQGEEGVDCGGPCKPCPDERPLVPVDTPLRYFLVGLTIILLIIIIIISIRYLKMQRLKKQKKTFK